MDDLPVEDLNIPLGMALREAGLEPRGEGGVAPLELEECYITPSIAREMVRLYELFNITPVQLIHVAALSAHDYLLHLVKTKRIVDPHGTEIDSKVGLIRIMVSLEKLWKDNREDENATFIPLTPAASKVLHAYSAALGCSIHTVANMLLDQVVPDVYEDPWSIHPIDIRLEQFRQFERKSSKVQKMLQEPRETFVLLPPDAVKALTNLAERAQVPPTTMVWKVLVYRVPLLLEELRTYDEPKVLFERLLRTADQYRKHLARVRGVPLKQERTRVRISRSLSHLLGVVSVMTEAPKLTVALVAVYQECKAVDSLSGKMHAPLQANVPAVKLLQNFLEAQELTVSLARKAEVNPDLPPGANRLVRAASPKLRDPAKDPGWHY